MANTSNPRFKAGDRVVYITNEDAYLGTVTERLYFIDGWRYSCDWGDGYTDLPGITYAESNFRRVH